MTETLDVHVRESDAFAWHMERDPMLRSTIVAVAVLDAAPDWDIWVDRMERATRLTPPFRQCLVEAPLRLTTPRWTPDPDFDLSWHLRRIEAPAPKTLDTVLDFARTTGMTAFDPARPLWEFTLVEGLDGGGAAIVMKLHHSLTDGIGGIELAGHVVDLQPEPSRQGPLPAVPAGTSPGPLGLIREALQLNAAKTAELARNRLVRLPSDISGAVRDPRGAVDNALETARSIYRFVAPVTTTLSPVMTERRLSWHYDTLDVPLGDLKRAARTAGGTLNDGFVAGIAGGLRLYHERHGATVDALRLTMPISIRKADDPAGGNRVTLVRLAVPVGIADPAARILAIGRLCADSRSERAIPYSNAIAGVLNLLPNAVTGGMLKHVDFLASNVPGFSDPIWIGGARLLAFFPFGPTLGSAANITLMSYEDTCHIGVNTDTGAVPDPRLFLESLRDGFEEVLALGGEHLEVRLPTLTPR